jgi:hypothetical protein
MLCVTVQHHRGGLSWGAVAGREHPSRCSLGLSQSQSQSYFTTGGLPPLMSVRLGGKPLVTHDTLTLFSN